MKRRLSGWFPQKIKYRFFVSFLLFILLPAAAMVFYYFNALESSLKENISAQSATQLNYMKESLENTRFGLFAQSLVLSKDKTLLSTLRDDSADSEKRRLAVTEHLLENRLADGISPFLSHVYYTLIDHRHREVHSTLAGQMNYSDFSGEERWRNHEELQWAAEGAGSTMNNRLKKMYTLTVELAQPDGSLDGHLLISFDYMEWMNSLRRFFTIRQDYFIVDQSGSIVMETSPDVSLSVRDIGIVRARSNVMESFWTNGQDLLNAVYLPSYKWHLVNRFPLDTFFGDIDQAKRRLVCILVLFSLLFIFITFVISHRITRPLQLLQHHMSIIVGNRFKSALPEKIGPGEVRELGITFNRMIADIRSLIHKLKVEEREKEASRFQMLLAQMNPHFLLNTLNAIKWTALGHKDSEIAEICVSLGELLEASLNVQTDLIHLHEELTLVQAHVRIQNFRFDSNIAVHYEYDDSLRYALVPKLSLQPLVENSFYHGFTQMQEQGCITIRVYAEDRFLLMEVTDNGIGLEASANNRPLRQSKGIGIGNLRERLQLLFKSDGQLEMLPLDNGTLVRLKFPLLLSDPYQKGE
ncbi:sensor histidine kinase [Paenibacillus sp. YN15]|uniref:sensor histidine kinase n=1 Tax=Paenibacillus sp. YN15 TaxID=1742774 RepID=UPI000DCCC3BB|nr:sensor histidine kinase [Paenibacillus sp. YN15]RAV05009.1 hypothetical protein DQG13_03775 [Paenibacillus sp. YN15]